MFVFQSWIQELQGLINSILLLMWKMQKKNALVGQSHTLKGKKGFQKGFSCNNMIILSVNFGILKHFITSFMAISQAESDLDVKERGQ